MWAAFPTISRTRKTNADESIAELTAALSSLEKIAWVRLSDDTVRFTVIPDMGSQVWALVTPGRTLNIPFRVPG